MTSKHKSGKRRDGFVLVVVVTLLAAVLLILAGLGALLRVDSIAGSTADAIAEARRNAMFSLRLGIGQLQRYTGNEEIVTGCAQILDTNTPNPNWCGVWSSEDDSGPMVWLVSGNERLPLLNAPATALNENGATSVVICDRSLAKEAIVRVPKVQIPAVVPATSDSGVVGRYAYWIADESTKISMNRTGDAPLPPDATDYPSVDVAALFPGLNLTDEQWEKLLTVDQLLHCGVSEAALRDVWHSTTVGTHRLNVTAGGAMLSAAPYNVNSLSQVGWRAVWGAVAAEIGATNTDTLTSHLVAAAHPIRSLGRFEDAMQSALVASGNTTASAAAIVGKLAPILCVRGDTFLIRAYGEVVDPLNASGEPTASAYCEARVQRIPQQLVGARGWKYSIVYFRWLGPEDI